MCERHQCFYVQDWPKILATWSVALGTKFTNAEILPLEDAVFQLQIKEFDMSPRMLVQSSATETL